MLVKPQQGDSTFARVNQDERDNLISLFDLLPSQSFISNENCANPEVTLYVNLVDTLEKANRDCPPNSDLVIFAHFVHID